jgi:hypothetical protein
MAVFDLGLVIAKVEVLENTGSSYRLRIYTHDGTIDTPNMKGVGTPGVPLAVTDGGTGADTAEDALKNLGLTLPLPIANGGTGATTLAELLENIGLTLPLPIEDGGTGASTAAEALTALGGAASGSVIPKTGGAMTGTLSDAAAAQVRNIRYSTVDLIAGSSPLATGQVYFVYE